MKHHPRRRKQISRKKLKIQRRMIRTAPRTQELRKKQTRAMGLRMSPAGPEVETAGNAEAGAVQVEAEAEGSPVTEVQAEAEETAAEEPAREVSPATLTATTMFFYGSCRRKLETVTWKAVSWWRT